MELAFGLLDLQAPCWLSYDSMKPLVSLSPDYPTLMLRTSFYILIYRMGFSFSAAGLVAFLVVVAMNN